MTDRTFLIDSEDLESVQSSLQGYMITDDGGFYLDEIPQEISDTGAFSLVLRDGSSITIKQSACASPGLFLYQGENRFFISNSFFRLADALKGRLSLCKDAARALVFAVEVPCVFYDTLAEEIKRLDAHDTVTIDIKTRKLVISKNRPDYFKKSISKDDPCALDLLDKWYDKWVKVYRGIAENERGYPFTADLSGGLDSRITLSMLRNAGIDLSSITILTNKAVRLAKDAPDMKIATQIAADLGFCINQKHSNNTISNRNADRQIYPQEALEAIRRVPLGHTVSVLPVIAEYDTPLIAVKGVCSMLKGDYWDGSSGTILRYLYRKRKAPDPSAPFRKSNKLSQCSYKRYIKHQINLFEGDANKIRDGSNAWLYYQLAVERFDTYKIWGWMNRNQIVVTPYVDPMILSFDPKQVLDTKDRMALSLLILSRNDPKLLSYPIEGRNISDDTLTKAADYSNARIRTKKIYSDLRWSANTAKVRYMSMDDWKRFVQAHIRYPQTQQLIRKLVGRGAYNRIYEIIDNRPDSKEASALINAMLAIHEMNEIIQAAPQAVHADAQVYHSHQ